MNDIMDEDDEIVRELDVYLTDNDMDLFLLQFPLRPIYHEPPTNIANIQYKPGHKRLELSIPYPEEIVDNQIQYNREDMQKILSSNIRQNAALCIGLVRDNALHLTPVDEILQLRPTFQNIKSYDETIESFIDDDDPEKIKSENEPKIQQVQLKRKESERAQMTRRQSYGHMQSLEESEPWIKLTHYEIGTVISSSLINALA